MYETYSSEGGRGNGRILKLSQCVRIEFAENVDDLGSDLRVKNGAILLITLDTALKLDWNSTKNSTKALYYTLSSIGG